MRNSPGDEAVLSKKILRDKIQSKRDMISAVDRITLSSIICSTFIKSNFFSGANNIFSYYPFRSEVDTTIILRHSIKIGKNIILPRISGNRELELYYVRDFQKQLTEGAYGIMEPYPPLCKKAALKDIDLIIVPGVAFTKNLDRLGYGGGFYDKMLASIDKSTLKIALCFKIQIVDNIPVDIYDIKMDRIITEERIYPGNT